MYDAKTQNVSLEISDELVRFLVSDSSYFDKYRAESINNYKSLYVPVDGLIPFE